MTTTLPTLPKHLQSVSTLGALRSSHYKPRTIKDELRSNLITHLAAKKPIFSSILGYEETVIPEIETAILARHNVLLLGLRGQAKTRIAREMVGLLDEWVPVVTGAELNDDPLMPISRYALDTIAEHGDATPIHWLHRSERYVEKLATPDVSVADLIGDLDPIKAAALKLPYSDERVIHFGLIARSHRSIFVINELPDLQARIQVALFNILQERDVQIRGFKLRLPLDIHFVFTANPEDYTNRGSIVTPLKDRIESQILTHYPKTLEVARKITRQEARLTTEQQQKVKMLPLVEDLIAQIAIEARKSELVDAKSGVSARLTISAYENIMSHAERRLIITGDASTHVRISDLYAAIPAITGKVELVYEGEQEGPANVAHTLISKAIRSTFVRLFPNPETLRKKKQANPYQAVIDYFNSGKRVDLLKEYTNADYYQTLTAISNLKEVVNTYHKDLDAENLHLYMEFLLHGLAEYSQISRQKLETRMVFKDMLGGLMGNGADYDLESESDFMS